MPDSLLNWYILRTVLLGASSATALWVAAFAYFGLRRTRGLPLAALSGSVFVWNASTLMIESIPRLPFDRADFFVHLFVNTSHIAYSVFLPLLYIFARGDGFASLRKPRFPWLFGIPVAANILMWVFPPRSGGVSPIMLVVFLVQIVFGALMAVLAVVTLHRRSKDPKDVERVSVARVLVAAAVFSAVFALYRAGAFRGHGLDPSPIAVTVALVIVAAGYHRLDPFTAVAENENRLRRFEFMVDASHEFMSIINREYRYEAVNAAFCASMKRSREEIIGRSVEEVWGRSRFAETIKPPIDSCLAGSPLVYRSRFQFGDEAPRYMEVSYFPFVPPGAEAPSHAVVVTKDISAYVRKEEELEEARHRADEANKAKSDFLASMSHEIRTPINAVMGLAELSLKKPLEPELRDDLETMKAASVNLLALVNDILDLSKIEAGGMKLENIPFSPRESLERTVKSFRPAISRKGISLELSADDRLPPLIMGDPLRFSQILFNLIGNAVKFTERGGVFVSLLKLPVKREDGAIGLRVEVRDTGIGIAEEKLVSIFESFSQASEGTSRKYGGSGLGLTISRRLARMFGGDIAVESVAGSGSSFSFDAYFAEAPAGSADHQAETANQDAVPAEVGTAMDSGTAYGANMLLVEDNPINARVALRFLSSVGKRVDHAVSGREALRLASERRYDLVLMDVEMPDMDGLETTRRIRAGEAGPDAARVPIVAMTAHSGSEFRTRCAGAGMDDFLSKPLDFAELETVVSRFEHPYARAEALRGYGNEAEAQPAVELPLIDKKNALVRLGGDEELLDELFGILRSEAADRSSRALGYSEIGDYPSLADLAHQVKGAAATLGAERLASAASVLDKAARAADSVAAASALEGFLSVYALTYKALSGPAA